MKKFSLLIAALLLTTLAHATQYVVTFTFDSVNGFRYNPDNFQVNIGDTIFWEGDFTSCRLTSVVVPTGAQVFGTDKGNEYMYVVTVPGEYHYESPDYYTNGMTGIFFAPGYNNVETPSIGNNVQPLYIVMENGQNVMYSSYTGRGNSDFILNIYDETGRMIVGTTISPNNTRYVLPQMPTGVYIVRVADNETPMLAKQVWWP